MADLQTERTVVLVKPDGVQRGLVGDIISRFEKIGLKITAIKMVWVDKEIAGQHYPESRKELMEGIGKKTLEAYEKYGKDPNEEFGTKDAVEIGKMINKWNIDFISSGPVVAILLQGIHAVENTRRLVGTTLPSQSPPGTIRGDYSSDAPALANKKGRPLRNIVHASGTLEEAKYEEQLWFRDDDVVKDYKRSDEAIMFE